MTATTNTKTVSGYVADHLRWSLRPMVIDVGLVVTLLGLASIVVLVGPEATASKVENWLLVAAAVTPLLWRRLRPNASFAATLAAVAVGTALDNEIALPVLVFSLYAVARYAKIPDSAVALVAGLLLMSGSALLQSEGLAASLASGIPMLIPWLLGDRARLRADRKMALYERIDDLEFDSDRRAREAIVEERLRFARELHDVVSHSISAMALHAGGARSSSLEMSPEVREMFAVIEDTARQELGEIRQLLRALRTDTDPNDVGPSVHLNDVEALVDRHRSDDLAISVEFKAQPRPVAPNVELAGYRIIHEALRNARRHGGATQVVVEIGFFDDSVEIRVADNGTAPAPTTNGFGLIGMRERAHLLDGTFHAEATELGWIVRTTLPLPKKAAASL